MVEQLTTEEAQELIQMIKISLTEMISSPECGSSIEFDAKGQRTKDVFTIKIFRGKINKNKYNYGARIKKNGIILLELHINAGNIHINPNGEKINGSHWHYYTLEDGLRNAFPAKDLSDNDFVENTIKFLEQFHVTKILSISHQTTLF